MRTDSTHLLRRNMLKYDRCVLTILLIMTSVILAAGLMYFLLSRVTAWGGDRKDALELADQFMTEPNMYRGSISDDDTPWDGVNRVAPPTQDGGLA